MEEGVNVNTDTSATEEISQSGGNQAVSFDDLQDMESAAERAVEQKKSEKVSSHIEEGKPAKAAAKPAKAESKEEVASEGAESEEGEEALPDVEMFRLKNGRDDIELRSDMEIPVKIDGEESMVSLEELRRGYSGQQAVTQRFQELSEKSSQYDADRGSLDGFIEDVFQDVETDPFASMVKIAERAGLDPVKYQMNLLDSLAEHADQWNSMSDQDREIYRSKMENESLTKRLDSQRTINETEQGRQALDSQISGLQRKLGVDREEFAEAYYELLDHNQEEGITDEVTPEAVADWIVQGQDQGSAASILAEISPELSRDWEAVEMLTGVKAENKDLTDDDLRDIAQEVWGNTKSKKISQKLAKGKPDLIQQNSARDPQKTPLSFDDL